MPLNDSQFTRNTRVVCAFTLALLTWAMSGLASDASAQTPAASDPGGVFVPSFWDPKRRIDKVELPPTTVIRFLTESDYPPFNYAGPDGNASGFNVDLARAICEELRVACTVQTRRFDTLLAALAENRGDAVIASIAPSVQTRRQADFTDPYYRSPARFVALRTNAFETATPESLEGRKVAVIAGTSHEAYLKTVFTGVELKLYPDAEAARQALRNGEADLMFGDGFQLAVWLNGSESQNCCAFRGGPFLESRFFGEGIGIAVRRGNDQLRQALNWALFRIWERGRFTDLWLRYFPVSPF